MAYTCWPSIWLRLAVTMVTVAFAVSPAAAVDARQPVPGTQGSAVDAPVPIEFPRDDGPHQAPIEWWYYTGHLATETGDRYGFEFVVFKGERGGIVAYAAHFAVTDNRRGEFRYDERLVAGAGVSTPVPGGGFDLRVGDWRMTGTNGEDRLVASMPGYAISLRLTSVKPPVLHGGDGYIPYGDGQATYYYSRTRIDVTGSLAVAGEPMPVRGTAWLDRQWGAFTTYEDGGWDWFSLQLDDNREVMLYRILAPDRTPEFVHGSLVAPDGDGTDLAAADVTVSATGSWTSPTTGTTYPSGWEIEVPEWELAVTLTPSLLGQELDTTASTGQLYWEGEVTVTGTRAGRPVTGLGYVELTGYAEAQNRTTTS